MRESDFRLRHQALQPPGRRLNRFDVVMEEVDLPAAVELAEDRLLYDVVIVMADEGLYREAPCGRCRDDGEVPEPGEGEVEGPRNRRRGKRQDVDVGAHRLDLLLLPHAEAVLLVHDEEPQILELNLAGEELVRPDDDVDGAGLKLLNDFLRLLRGFEAGEHLDGGAGLGEALGEGLEVLLREKRRRGKDRGLLAVQGGEAGGP